MGRIEDSDLTIQELVLRKWEDEWDERLKTHIQRIAEEMDCTWWDIVWRTETSFWMKGMTFWTKTRDHKRAGADRSGPHSLYTAMGTIPADQGHHPKISSELTACKSDSRIGNKLTGTERPCLAFIFSPLLGRHCHLLVFGVPYYPLTDDGSHGAQVGLKFN
jgi:hypothetical protein